MKLISTLTFGLAALVATASHATTLTTTFASNNSFAGNMFDVSVTGAGVTISSVEVNTEATGSVDLFLYTRSGTFVGSENAATGWVLHDSGTVTGQGLDTPTAWDLADLALGNDSVTGFYIGIGDYGDTNNMKYTNGTAVGNVAATDGVLTIFEGIGKGDGFTASSISTRIWNGSLIYGDIAPVPLPAGGLLLATGVAVFGLRRRKRR